ncbi:hypothetical protein TNCV_4978901 [Trichonephila clavipes]|nr:hypothetical protein TNCV_4978901 [Trichonephila clavipes]
MNEVHICQLGHKKTVPCSSVDDDSSNDCGNTHTRRFVFSNALHLVPKEDTPLKICPDNLGTPCIRLAIKFSTLGKKIIDGLYRVPNDWSYHSTRCMVCKNDIKSKQVPGVLLSDFRHESIYLRSALRIRNRLKSRLGASSEQYLEAVLTITHDPATIEFRYLLIVSFPLLMQSISSHKQPTFKWNIRMRNPVSFYPKLENPFLPQV